jgi:integrase
MNFEEWLYKNGRYPSTIKKHLIRLRVLNRNLSEWNLENIDCFIIAQIKKGYSPACTNSYIDTIRLYAQFNKLPDEIKNYKHYRRSYSVKGTMSDDEIERLIDLTCPNGSNNKIWNTYSLFYSILAYTGCRPHEICQLKKENIDWGRNVFSIEHTKTGMPRLVPIPPNIADKVKSYCDSIKTDHLFLTRQGKVFSHGSYYHDFKRRIEMLGIDRPHISLYSLRHSFITSLLEADVNIHKIAKIVGHSIKQTAHYEHLTTKDICSAILKHPMIRKGASSEDIIKDIKEYVENYDLDNYVHIKYTLLYTNGELTIKIRPN